MILNFNINQGLVVATVKRVQNADYFFVQNGEPEHILCHCKQGGNLELTPTGAIVMTRNQEIYPPSLGDKVVLIRDTNNRTKAARWAIKQDWDEVSWAVNAKTTFRAVAYNHRNNGKFQSNTKHDVVLVEDSLINICRQFPRNASVDTLKSGFSSKLGPMTLSYEVRWEKLETDGTWTECGEPRPAYVNGF